MFSFLKNNQLLKVLGFSSVATIVQFITGFISIKLIAHFLGTEGMVFLGNFKNFNSSLKTFSTLGFDGGVIKLISEHKKDSKKVNQIISTSFISRLGVTIALSIILIFFADYFNSELFNNYNYKYLIYALAISLPVFTINSLIIAVINGFQKFKFLISSNIITSLLGLLISAFLIWHRLLVGAILSIILIESISIFITYYFFIKSRVKVKISSKFFSKKDLKILVQFSIMTLSSAIIIPGSHFIIRNEIVETLNIDNAGYWEALNRISNYYMLIVTSVVSMYYLPKLSSIHTNSEFRKELIVFFKTLVPLFIIMVSIIYLLRKQAVLFILNESFLPVAELFLWQIIGNVFNVLSLAFGYQILAKAMTKTYIFIEVTFYALYLILIHISLPKLGLNGVVMSYAFTNFVSLIIMLIIFRKTLIVRN